MSVIHLRSFADDDTSTAGDRSWFQIVRRMIEVQGTPKQVYLIRTSRREANGLGGIPILPTSQDLEPMLDEMNATTRKAIHASLLLMEDLRFLGSITEVTGANNVEDSGQVDDEEGSETRIAASQAKDFKQSSSQVKTSALGTNDQSGPICKDECSRLREDSNEPASESESRLPE